MGKKYNVGDHVVIKESNVDFIYGSHEGKTGVIIDRSFSLSDYCYLIKLDDGGYEMWCDVKGLVGENNVNGNDARNVKFKTGDFAKIVKNTIRHGFPIGTVVRLTKTTRTYHACDVDGNKWYVIDEELEKCSRPKEYSFLVVCVDNGNIPEHLTVGKVYRFVRGKCKNDLGGSINSVPVYDCEELNALFSPISSVRFSPVGK